MMSCMSQALTIVARITAVADQVELVKSELGKLIAPSRADEGCVQYDMHQDNDDPAQFLFFEIWETRELWLAHMEQPHLAAFGAATEGAVADLAINEMTKVG